MTENKNSTLKKQRGKDGQQSVCQQSTKNCVNKLESKFRMMFLNVKLNNNKKSYEYSIVHSIFESIKSTRCFSFANPCTLLLLHSIFKVYTVNITKIEKHVSDKASDYITESVRDILGLSQMQLMSSVVTPH